jgi:hypothetical protein
MQLFEGLSVLGVGNISCLGSGSLPWKFLFYSLYSMVFVLERKEDWQKQELVLKVSEYVSFAHQLVWH